MNKIVQNILTGLVNLFSFLSLFITTTSDKSFMAALLILSFSLFLEGLSFWETLSLSRERNGKISLLLVASIYIIYIISILGIVTAISGLAGFVSTNFIQEKSIHVIISSVSFSILYLPQIDISYPLVISMIYCIVLPLLFAIKEDKIIQFRKTHYNLKSGLFGK